MTWTNIKLQHNVPIKELIKYTKDDLKAEDTELYIQLVQYHIIKVLEWILHLHRDSEIKSGKNF